MTGTSEDDKKGAPAPEVTPEEKKAAPKTSEKVDNETDDTIKWRAKYKATKEELETIKHNTEKEKGELASKVDATTKERQMFEEKYIDAEIKAHAVAAGLTDLDLVKLIDKSEVKLDEKGNLVGVDKAIADFKTKKPAWFGSEKKVSTSSGATMPEKDAKKTVNARDMSKDDWKKNKSQYMSGQF